MENRWFGDSRSCLFEVINVLRISLVDTSHVKRWSGGGKVLTKKKEFFKGIRLILKIGQKNREGSVVSTFAHLHKLISAA